MGYALSLHMLAAIIWVGGMFFAHWVLRPAAVFLPPAERLSLMQQVFARFFPWVWGALLTLLVTGYWLFLGPMQGHGGWHVHLMAAVGVLMAVIFAYIYFIPYRRFVGLMAREDFGVAAGMLARIRLLILTNLLLGLVLSGSGVLGRFV